MRLQHQHNAKSDRLSLSLSKSACFQNDCSGVIYRHNKIWDICCLIDFERRSESELTMSARFQIDFWTYPTDSLDPVEIHVEPVAVQKLEALLNGASISFTVSTEDLNKIVQQEKGTSRAGGFDGAYHRLGEVILISQK